MGQLVIPSGSKVYVDTAVLIYTFEGNTDYFDLLKPLWKKFQGQEIELISSELILSLKQIIQHKGYSLF